MESSSEVDTGHLEKIAIKAAARHSDNLAKAVLEFVRLAYIESVPPLINDPNDAGKIMQKLLPPYRFPANDLFCEKLQYYGYTELSCHGTMITLPCPFLTELKKINVPEKIIKEITEYAIEAEQKKIQLNECIQTKSILEKKLQAAEEVWNNNINTRSEKRNALVVQSLGFSTGKVQRRQDPRKIFIDYVDLIRKKGQSKNDATESIRKKYALSSFDRTQRILQDHRRSIYDKAKRISPELKKAISDNLKGLLFGNSK